MENKKEFEKLVFTLKEMKIENKKNFISLVEKLSWIKNESPETEKEKEFENKIEGVLLAAEIVFDYADYTDIVLAAYQQ